MTGFDDSALAARTRDAVNRLIIRAIDRERPPYFYAKVKQIDPDLRSVKVWQHDDGAEADSANWLTVRVGSLVPSFVDQLVRVSGRLGDKYISDVIGAVRVTDIDAGDLAAPATFDLTGGIGMVTAQWAAVTGAPKYQVEFADDAAFTINSRAFETVSTAFMLSGVTPGTTVYGRARGLNNLNQGGAWSSTDSAVALDFPEQELTDGSAPSASPQPVVRGGVGFLVAEWLATPNADLVTYDVYISATSGFAPSSLNFKGSTTGTFFTLTNLTNGDPLVAGTQYYVRLIARDADGPAAVGAQGAGTPRLVETGDVGNVAVDDFSDGTIPTASPGAPSITAGIGYLYVKWDHIINDDPVTYELHISSTSGFTAGPNTKVLETPSNFGFIRRLGPGVLEVPLVYGTTYYVRVWAKDADGYALSASAQTAAAALRVNTVDIQGGAITAASAILADLAVENAKIANLAVTTAKIADLSVSSAKINDLAVSTAKIADLAVSTAKIGNLAVTSAKINDLSASKITAGTIASQEIILNGVLSVLRSANYVTGVSGWAIKGNGFAEFYSVTIRNSAFVGGVLQTVVIANADLTLGTNKIGNAVDNAYMSFASSQVSIQSLGGIQLTGPVHAVSTVRLSGIIDNALVSTGNVWIDDNDFLSRAVSSRKYKIGIRPIVKDFDTGLLHKIDLVSYRVVPEARGNWPADKRGYGFIAEDMARIHEDLATYKDGEPHGINSHIITVMLVGEVQKLRADVDALKEKKK